MITIDNYFNKVPQIKFSELPDALQKGHEFILKGSQSGSSWAFYSSSPTIKKTVDIYLSKLNDFVDNSSKADRKQKKAASERQEYDETIKDATVRQGLIDKDGNKIDKAEKARAAKEIFQPTMVERMPEELRFIRRFVNLSGKTKTKEDILRFIHSLQKAIVEKRIRKTSPYADQIKYVQ